MEKLTVKNFLTIREAELEVMPFTIIIGPQASGKSVLAKLVYFFRRALSELVPEGIEVSGSGAQIAAALSRAFPTLFPAYAWNRQHFVITYTFDDWAFTLTNEANTGLDIQFSEVLQRLIAEAIELRNAVPTDKQAHPSEVNQWNWYAATMAAVPLRATLPLARKDVFVPASRSFFALMQPNLFRLLQGGVSLNPLLVAFGAAYEQARFRPGGAYALRAEVEVNALTTQILTGSYSREDDQDWVVTNGQRVNLADASSGQQEALPLLLVLTASLRRLGAVNFLIEEPEAHLFPSAQKQLVDLFSIVFEAGSQFLLTTHSPYILTALNDCMQAANVIEERPLTEAEARRILGDARPIAYAAVRAYTLEPVEGGSKLVSILDEETRLIGASVIDAVSDDFERIFNQLLHLRYPDDDANS